MKNRYFNILNILIVIALFTYIIFQNHNLIVKPNNEINNLVKVNCATSTEKDILCEKEEVNGKLIPIKFNYSFETMTFEAINLFIVLLLIVVTASLYRFHRITHTGFSKNILTKIKYKKFIKKEFLHVTMLTILITTLYFFTLILVCYVASDIKNINLLEVFTMYLNTLSMFIVAAAIGLFINKKVSNIFVFVTYTVLMTLAIYMFKFLIVFVLEYTYLSENIKNFLGSIFLPFLSSSLVSTFLNIVIAIGFIISCYISYKDKERYIIYGEK